MIDQWMCVAKMIALVLWWSTVEASASFALELLILIRYYTTRTYYYAICYWHGWAI